MIYTERTVRITNGVANIDAPIILYRGDRQVEILFEIMDSKFKFSSEKGNYIKNVEASFGQLAIDCPDGSDVFTEVAPCINGAVTFTITGEMIDELYEVGFYSFHIRLFNNDQSSRITIPPIMKGIEIREPIVIEGDDYGEVAMVDYGQVDEAVIENEQATFLDENGNLNIEWKKGDIISSLRLNQMVGYINDHAVPGEQGPQGEKGEQGPKGDKGEQGPKGEDGLTTSIAVNGSTFVHQNGVITLPDYTTVESVIPTDLTIDSNNLLQLKDTNGNAIGTGVIVSGGTGGTVDLTGYAQKTDIPTKTSQLTNDSDFATNASVDEKIANVNGANNESLTGYIEPTYANNLITTENRVTSFINNNGLTITGTFTNYIPMKKGESYISNIAYNQYHFFDSNKTHVSSVMYVTNPQIFVPGVDGYLLVKTENLDDVILEGTDLGALRESEYKLQRAKVQPTSKWYGKKWLCIGDSISTDSVDLATVGYAKLISRELGMTVTNVAVSGKTMSYFYNLIDNYPENYDLITVMLGANNHGYNCAIGQLNDDVYTAGTHDSNNSFFAQAQLLYEKLRVKYPKSVIMFIGLIKRWNSDESLNNSDGFMINGVNKTTEDYSNALKEMCNWYSIPFVDVYNTIDPRSLINRQTFFCTETDGTHPNDLGHALFIAPVIRDAIIKHEPYFFNDWSTAETYGNIVTNVSEISINEGSSNTFNITLDKAPTNEQTINIVSNNTDVVVNPNSLTFTSYDYNVAKTVTVNAKEDDDTTNDTATITLSNSKVVSKTVLVTVVDNDTPVEVTTYTITNSLTNVTNNNSATNVNEGTNYTATLSANNGYVLDTVTVTMGGTDITSDVYSNGVINISSVIGNIVIIANAIVQSSGGDYSTDLKTLIYDFTTLNAGNTSISSTGTEIFDITLPEIVSDGYVDGEVSKDENYNPSAVDFLNDSDFTIISKYQTENSGVYPYILSTSYKKHKDGYSAYVSKKITSITSLYMATAPTNGFYKERYLTVSEYLHDTDDKNASYYANGVSDKNITIPYDAEEHIVAITYNNISKQMKIYVDGVYKDYIDLSEILNPITWTGLCFGIKGMRYFNLYISNQCGTDDETIALMNNIFIS